MVKEKIEAKNKMEEQLYQVKSKANDEKDEGIKALLSEAIKKYDDWLFENPMESKEVYEEKTKEMNDAVAEITSINGGSSNQFDPSKFNMPETNQYNNDDTEDVKIEEID
jgi:phage I-like protein